MNINKYSPYCFNHDDKFKAGMALDDDGNYVLATDYDTLNQENQRLTKLLADERAKANARIEELEGEIANMVDRI